MGLQGEQRENFEKKLEPYVGIEIGVEDLRLNKDADQDEGRNDDRRAAAGVVRKTP